MSKVIKLRKGLDIALAGVAEKVTIQAPAAASYALVPADYIGVTPKPLLKVDDPVKAGDPIFFDKENPEVLFTSPVSGTIKEIVRGDKRKILAITITPDGRGESVVFDVPTSLTAVQVRKLLIDSGLWTTLVQRPFGVIAKVDSTPRAIFVSAFDSSPLAPDMSYVLKSEKANVEAAVAMLSKIAPVYLGINPGHSLADVKGAQVTTFVGRHPVGNVGVQIANVAPIAKGEVLWTIDIQHLVMIGRLARTGKLDMTKTIALTGSQITKPQYVKVMSGASIKSIVSGRINGGNARLINGNVLSGTKVEENGYLGFYSNMITAIPEGDYYEFAGWAMPRVDKFSVSRSYFSWLMPRKRYDLDTNLNGGERAFVMTGIYERVLPMDIYPMYLLKAVMAGDIDKMENLGIYEVVEEDLALCEFICPSKIEWQATLRDGITKMIKEL